MSPVKSNFGNPHYISTERCIIIAWNNSEVKQTPRFKFWIWGFSRARISNVIVLFFRNSLIYFLIKRKKKQFIDKCQKLNIFFNIFLKIHSNGPSPPETFLLLFTHWLIPLSFRRKRKRFSNIYLFIYPFIS